MKKIGNVKILHTDDNDPDLSRLGEYTDRLTTGIIVRYFDKFYEDLSDDELENIPERSNEYRGFKPSTDSNDPKDKDYKKYSLQNYHRMEDINNGNVGFIGISVKAEILTWSDSKNWLINEISSGGLWGIESDGGAEYLKEIEQEEISELKDVLKEYGFSDAEIEKAFENIQEVD